MSVLWAMKDGIVLSRVQGVTLKPETVRVLDILIE